MQQPSTRSDGARDAEAEVRRIVDRGRLAWLLRREPVNPVDGADDDATFDRSLLDRTDVDRRVYELIDPAAADRPRTVVWVALTRDVPCSLEELIDDRPPMQPEQADTAVFWSIWNVDDDSDRPQASRGPGGRDLIDGSVRLLRDELPALRTFVTLSPIPGLRRWITGRTPDRDDPAGGIGLAATAARYLSTLGEDGRPIDAVARFHLGNGARLWRVNLDADRSDRGLGRSYGVMANYRYAPEDRAANRELLRTGAVAVSDEVAGLIDGPTG